MRIKQKSKFLTESKLRLGCPRRVKIEDIICGSGGMADALDSGSSECKFMRVQVPSSAPKDQLLPLGSNWSFFIESRINRAFQRLLIF